MYFKIDGIVIKEKPFSETSKTLTVLTAHRGVIYLNARGARKLSAKNFTTAQLFAYSEMTLYGNKGPFYTLTDAKLIENFYDLRNDPIILSLACYLAELATITATVSEEDDELLRLFLNSLWFLQENPERHIFVKAVFELRLMFNAGFCPDFSCCECGSDISEGRFNIETGELFCKSCPAGEGGGKLIPAEVISALKYIAYCDLRRVFAFSLSEHSQTLLASLAEKYLCYRVEGFHKRLAYYKQMAEFNPH